MPGLVGADVEQLRALSRRFAEAADRLRAVVAETSGRLNSVNWVGPDANRFRSQWQGESAARLRNAANALDEAAIALRRNADEQDQASAAVGGFATGLFGSDAPRPIWTWPGGALPGLVGPDSRIVDPGTAPTLPVIGDGHALPWVFTNPFDDYRQFVDQTPIWPISVGTAIGMTPAGDVMGLADGAALIADGRLGLGEKVTEGAHLAADLAGGQLRQAGFDSRNPALYLSGVATAQWGDVVSEFAKADFSPATVANNAAFIAEQPEAAFAAARDAVLGYLPKLISNFTVNPFGK